MEKEKEEIKEKTVRKVENPMDGPTDGVTLHTQCVRTEFLDNPKEEEQMFQQAGKTDATVSASVEIGVFSIRDKQSDVMLSISIDDAMVVLREALAASHREDAKCKENAENVDKQSTSEEQKQENICQ